MITRARRVPRPVQLVLALIAGYLVIRGIAEPFVIDVTDSSTYRLDWGGPSLLGVLAVHSGPAAAILVGLAIRTTRGTR